MTDPSRRRGLGAADPAGVPNPVQNTNDRPTGWGLKDTILAVGIGAGLGAGVGAYAGMSSSVGALTGAEGGAIVGATGGGLYSAYRYYTRYDPEKSGNDPSVTPEERGVIEVLGNNPFGWWAAGVARTGKDWYNSFATTWGFKQENIESWKNGATPYWTKEVETVYKWDDKQLVAVIDEFFSGDRGQMHRYIGLGSDANFGYFNWWIFYKYGWRQVTYPDLWTQMSQKSAAELWPQFMVEKLQARNEDPSYTGSKYFFQRTTPNVTPEAFLKWTLALPRVQEVFKQKYSWTMDDAMKEYRKEHGLVDTEQSWKAFFDWADWTEAHTKVDLSELGHIDPSLEKYFKDNYGITVEQAYINYRKSYPRPGPEYQSKDGARGWLAWARDTYKK